MNHQDGSNLRLRSVMGVLRAPLAFILALAMFITPLSDLSAIFADEMSADGAIVLQLGNVYTMNDSPWSGETTQVFIPYSLSDYEDAGYTEVRISLPLVNSEGDSIADLIDLELLEESLQRGCTLDIKQTNGFYHAGIDKSGEVPIVYWDFIDSKDYKGSGGAGSNTFLQFDLHFKNGVTPKDTEALINPMFTGRDSDDSSQSVTGTALTVTANAGEDWSLAKSVASTTYWDDTKICSVCVIDGKVTSGHEDHSYRVTYEVKVTAEPKSKSNDRGRYQIDSFTLSDLVSDADLPDDGEPNLVSVELISHSVSDFTYTGTGVGEDSIVTHFYNPIAGWSPEELKYKIVMDYPMPPYTKEFDSSQTTPTLTTVTNEATLNVEFVKSIADAGYSVKLEDQAQVELGWMKEMPGQGKITVQKSLMVSGQERIGDDEVRAKYLPKFRLEVEKGIHIGDDPKLNEWVEVPKNGTVNFEPLTPGVTYILYEELMSGVTVTSQLSSQDNTPHSVSQGPETNSWRIAIPNTAADGDIRNFEFSYSNTVTDSATVRVYKLGNTIESPEQYDLPLNGVTFVVYEDETCTSEFGEFITKTIGVTSGVYELHGLEPDKTYYLVEKVTDPRYALNTEKTSFTPRADVIISVEVNNELNQGQLVAYKAFFDQFGQQLNAPQNFPTNAFPKVRFAVYHEADDQPLLNTEQQPVQVEFDSVEGNALKGSAWLPEGSYYLMEKEFYGSAETPPYNLSMEKYSFEITSGELTTLGSAYDPEIKNRDKNGNLLIVKVGNDEPGKPIPASETGVNFAVYQGEFNSISDVTGSPYFTVNSANFKYQGASANDSYQHSKNLPEGYYTVVETQPPIGYALGENRSATVYVYASKAHELTYASETGVWTATYNSVVFYNEPLRTLVVEKIDSQTEGSLSGAEFKLYERTGSVGSFAYQPLGIEPVEDPKGIYTFTLDPNEVGNKTLYLVETQAPPGYEKPNYHTKAASLYDFDLLPPEHVLQPSSWANTETVTVKVENPPKYQFMIDKKDAYNAATDSIPGATFAVYKMDDDTSTYDYNSPEFQFTTPTVNEMGYLQAGATYQLYEIEAPSGYVRTDEVLTVAITSAYEITYTSSKEEPYVGGKLSNNLLTLPFKNPPETSILLEKWGNTIFEGEDVRLAGATFSVYEVVEDGDLLGPLEFSFTSGSQLEPDVVKIGDGTVTKFQTDAIKQTKISGLVPGKQYVLWEASAPEPYAIGSARNIELLYNDDPAQFLVRAPESVEDAIYKIYNSWGYGKLRVNKYALLEVNVASLPQNITGATYGNPYDDSEEILFNGQYRIYTKNEQNEYILYDHETLWTGTEITEGKRNSALSKWLPQGTYYVGEIAPPPYLRAVTTPAYELNDDGSAVLLGDTIVEGETVYGMIEVQVYAGATSEATFLNPREGDGSGGGAPILGRVQLEKFFRQDDKKPLDDAVFEVYALDPSGNYTGKEVLATIVSGTLNDIQGAGLSEAFVLLTADERKQAVDNGTYVVEKQFVILETVFPEGFKTSAIPYPHVVTFTLKYDGADWTVSQSGGTQVLTAAADGTYINTQLTGNGAIENFHDPIAVRIKKEGLYVSASNGKETTTPLSVSFTVYTDAACKIPALEANRQPLVVTTGSDGFVSINLPPGTYYLVEHTDQPITDGQGNRYIPLDEPIEFEIKAANNPNPVATVKNTAFPRLWVGKYSLATASSNLIGLKSVTVQVYYNDDNAFDNAVSEDDYKDLEYETFTITGAVKKSIELEPGHDYVVRETAFESNDRHYYDPDQVVNFHVWVTAAGAVTIQEESLGEGTFSKPLQIKNPARAKLTLQKVFHNAQGEPISGTRSATFSVYGWDGLAEEETVLATDPIASIGVSDSIADVAYLNTGFYMVKETDASVASQSEPVLEHVWKIYLEENQADNLLSYLYIDSVGQAVYDTAAKAPGNIINISDGGGLSILKKNMAGQPLTGAIFAVYQAEVLDPVTDPVPVNAVVYEDEYYVPGGQVYGAVYTTVEGKVYEATAEGTPRFNEQITSLSKDLYIFTEIKAPPGYALPKQPSKVANIVPSAKNEVSFNDPKLAQITLYKAELIDGIIEEDGTGYNAATESQAHGLNGATFAVYKLADGAGWQEVSDPEDITKTYQRTTATIDNVYGVAVFDRLDVGTYKLVEIQAPEGYSLTNETPGGSILYFEVAHGANDEDDLIVTRTDEGEGSNWARLERTETNGEAKIYATNPSLEYELKVFKFAYDTDGTKTGLLGARFSVWVAELVPGETDKYQKAENGKLGEFSTDDDGYGAFNRFSYHELGFIICEEEAPPGYAIDERLTPKELHLTWEMVKSGEGDEATPLDFENVKPVELTGNLEKWIKESTGELVSPESDGLAMASDFKTSLYWDKPTAKYVLKNFTDGKNPVPLNDFRISDGNDDPANQRVQYYSSLTDTSQVVAVADDEYRFTSITVGKATYRNDARDADSEVPAYAQLAYRKIGSANSHVEMFDVLDEPRTIDLTVLGQVYYFEVVYGHMEDSEFVPTVGAFFAAEEIELDIEFLGRNPGLNQPEILKITNFASLDFTYESSSGETEDVEAESYKVSHLLNSIDSARPPVSIEKVNLTTIGATEMQYGPGAKIDYSFTVTNLYEESDGPPLLAPIVVDQWDEHQGPITTGSAINDDLSFANLKVVGERMGDNGDWQQDETVLERLGEMTHKVDLQNRAALWAFDGSLAPKTRFTISYETNLNDYLELGVTTSSNDVYLTSGTRLPIVPDSNPLGLTFDDRNKGRTHLVGGDEANLDQLLAEWGYENIVEYRNYYEYDDAYVRVRVTAAMSIFKRVYGTLDTEEYLDSLSGEMERFLPYGATGLTCAGGKIYYKITLLNTREINQVGVRLVDTLPYPQDNRTMNITIPRGTNWTQAPTFSNYYVLDAEGNPIDNVDLYKFTEANQPQLTQEALEVIKDFTDWGAAGWKKTDISSTIGFNGSIGFDFGDYEFEKASPVYLYLELDVPEEFKDPEVYLENAQQDKFAYNNAAFNSMNFNPSGQHGKNNVMAECGPVRVAVQPFKVNLGDFVWEDRNYNGEQGDSTYDLAVEGLKLELYRKLSSDPSEAAGSLVQTVWSYNDGSYVFTDLDVTDESGEQYQYRVRAVKEESALSFSATGETDIPGDQFSFTVKGKGTHTDSDVDATGYTEWFGFDLYNLMEWNENAKTWITRDDTHMRFPLGAEATNNLDENGALTFYGDPTWDIGLCRYGGIGDRVWYDNRFVTLGDPGNTLPDGLQQPTTDHPASDGVSGVTVYLYRQHEIGEEPILWDGEPHLAGSQGYGSRVTDDQGYYWFGGLEAGTYWVEFDLSTNPSLSEYRWVKPSTVVEIKTGDSNEDSNALFLHNKDRMASSPRISLGYNEELGTVDAGIYLHRNAIGDYVWHDENRNGIQDEAADHGWNGLSVYLLDSGKNVVRTTTTAEKNGVSGYYLFEDIEPGTYYVRFTKPNDYVWTDPYATSSDRDSNGTTFNTDATMDSAAIQIDSLTYDLTFDAGFYRPGGGYIPTNPPGGGGTTTITIPGGTPAGTTLDFMVNNTPITVTVPVNIPAGTPYSYTFDPSSVPLANLPNLDLGKDVEEDILRTFEDETPLDVIPATGGAQPIALLFWGCLFLASVTLFSRNRKRLWG